MTTEYTLPCCSRPSKRRVDCGSPDGNVLLILIIDDNLFAEMLESCSLQTSKVERESSGIAAESRPLSNEDKKIDPESRRPKEDGSYTKDNQALLEELNSTRQQLAENGEKMLIEQLASQGRQPLLELLSKENLVLFVKGRDFGEQGRTVLARFISR